MNRVSIAETTLVHVGLVAAVSVACARLSVPIAISTIENRVSIVDLTAAHPPGSTAVSYTHLTLPTKA